MPRITVRKIPILVYTSASSTHRRLKSFKFTSNAFVNQEAYSTDSSKLINVIVSKVKSGRSHEEVFNSLMQDQACNTIPLSHNLVSQLLHRFKDDWKSAFAIFKWAESRNTYTPSSHSYETMLDILGKTKQMDKMMVLLEQMSHHREVTLGSIAKVMRRFCGAGKWEQAVIIFDDLDRFGLEKNTETMNLLLDTLCKESKTEQARKIFMELKSHIPPSGYTFNIFVHGWCKVNRVNEAHWTIQEMKGYGFNPSVITYSIIIESYCRNSSFDKAYELLDEMQAQNCAPNIITFTTIMCYLTKSDQIYEALQIPEKMKLFGIKPDVLFYNALIHTLAKAGRVQEAVDVFEVEMPSFGIIPTTSTYNSIIAMFCHNKLEQEALNVLKSMESCELYRPDIQTFSPLLKMCFRTGKTDVLLGSLLDEMINKYHISFDLATYTLLIHGLCRANKSEWAYELFKEMVDKDIVPRYRTCGLLLDELKQTYNYVAADHVEGYMNQMK